MIGLNLMELTDIANFTLTCPELQNIVHHNAHYCYFSAVSSLFTNENSKNLLIPVSNSIQVLPLIANWLGRTGILACRQVCKRWSADVDQFLLEALPTNENKWFFEFVKFYKFPLNQQQKDALVAMKDHARNPFVGRRLSFDSPFLAYSVEIRNQMTELLNSFGKYMCYFQCTFPIQALGAQDANLFLFELTSKCTNLRYLNIFGLNKCPYVPLVSIPSLPLLPENENLREVALQTSELYTQHMLSKYHRQLKSIEIFNLDELEDLPMEWPSLEWLKLLHCDTVMGINNLQNLDAPKLEQLDIYMVDQLPFNIVDLIRITNRFPALNRLSLILDADKCLMLSQAQIQEISDMTQKLCSASVEIVELGFTSKLSCIASFDFLMFLPNVKTLDIQLLSDGPMAPTPADEHGLVIKLVDSLMTLGISTRHIYESNVWEKCKRLSKIISPGRINYTRKEYKLYCTAREA